MADIQTQLPIKLTNGTNTAAITNGVINFGQVVTFPANQEIRIVCTPFGPINSNQSWQGNLILAA